MPKKKKEKTAILESPVAKADWWPRSEIKKEQAVIELTQYLEAKLCKPKPKLVPFNLDFAGEESRYGCMRDKNDYLCSSIRQPFVATLVEEPKPLTWLRKFKNYLQEILKRLYYALE